MTGWLAAQPRTQQAEALGVGTDDALDLLVCESALRAQHMVRATCHELTCSWVHTAAHIVRAASSSFASMLLLLQRWRTLRCEIS
jgi:hypothetical protein